jgi:hypothetical protein
MFDLEAIKKRHAAGAPACEDIPALIAEVERLQKKETHTEEKRTGLDEAIESGLVKIPKAKPVKDKKDS